MFTSRAEYRLLLREDNADLRLSEMGYKLGLLSESAYEKMVRKREGIKEELKRLKDTRVTPTEQVNAALIAMGSAPLKSGTNLLMLLRRSELEYRHLTEILPNWENAPPHIIEQVEIEIKYQGFLERQEQEAERLKKMEGMRIPPDLDYSQIGALSNEVRTKLSLVRPTSLGQAARIPGVTPVAVTAIMFHLKRMREEGCEK